MRRLTLIALGVALAGAILAGARGAHDTKRRASPKPRPVETPRDEAAALPSEGVAEPTRAPEPIDIRARLLKLEGDEIAKIEEEFEARVIEDPAFALQLFDVFLSETDPVKVSFLQNVLASHPPLRNDPEWLERFLKVAERDVRFDRRAAALLFIQQAETIRPVHDRLLALAEGDRELCAHALVALRGLPDRRLPDPRLVALAGRLAERETNPDVRGLAIRIEGNPQRAEKALSDPERVVRMHACQVVTSRAALEAAIRTESDPEVKQVMEFHFAQLK